jgi:hypothetical protein
MIINPKQELIKTRAGKFTLETQHHFLKVENYFPLRRISPPERSESACQLFLGSVFQCKQLTGLFFGILNSSIY